LFADRRTFVKSMLGAPLAALGAPASKVSAQTSDPLPAPGESGIDHIVIVTMENRSFDHLFGSLPGANGMQAGLSYTDNIGVSHSTYWLAAPPAPDYTGCGHPDPDHSYGPDRVAYDNGAMDGFLRAGSNDIYTIGYYAASDIPFYASLAQTYMACDNWFAAILGPTFPNRMFLWAAQTDRLDDSIGFSSLPTIFDRLAQSGISHRYYFNNVPYLALWGFKYLFSTSLFSDFLADAASGNLPAVSFVDPNYTVLDDGTGNDDHPHADIRNGDAFLCQVFNAVANGPNWANTVLIVLFDEWGGFFEHVPPPRVIAPNTVDPDLVNGAALLGFRIPAVVASPFTWGAGVNHQLYDHTAALKLIEWRWGLQPLTARDASPDINNPAASFNFSAPAAIVPVLPQVLPVFAPPCFEGGIFSASTAAPGARKVPAGAGKPNEYTALANSAVMREFIAHPRFQKTGRLH
jgi:phospholipase C